MPFDFYEKFFNILNVKTENTVVTLKIINCSARTAWCPMFRRSCVNAVLYTCDVQIQFTQLQ